MMEDYFNQPFDVKLKDARPEYGYQVLYTIAERFTWKSDFFCIFGRAPPLSHEPLVSGC